MNSIKFSIIVPTYNRAHLVEKTIRSIIQQNYTYYELIIVDDGSTDNTEEVVQKYLSQKIRYIKQPNRERGGSRNAGAEKSTGSYLNFFDSDDIAYPSHLEAAERYIKEKGMPEWFHNEYEIKSESNNDGLSVILPRGVTHNKLLARGNPIGTNTVFVRRDIFMENKFNEDRSLAGSEDYELWLRMACRYPLYGTGVITSALITHPERSVINMKPERLVNRITTLNKAICKNEKIQKYYKLDTKKIYASNWIYLSLHLSEISSIKVKIMALKYLTKAINIHPKLIYRKSIIAIIRNIILVN